MSAVGRFVGLHSNVILSEGFSVSSQEARLDTKLEAGAYRVIRPVGRGQVDEAGHCEYQ